MTELSVAPKGTYDNRKEYMQVYQLEWVKKRREKYLKKYGPCYFCESSDNLEIHHVDPSEKESNHIFSWKPERIEAELAKCIILCHNCHVKMHTLMKRKPFKHGTYYTYHVYKCRCKECRKANADYAMELKRRKAVSA